MLNLKKKRTKAADAPLWDTDTEPREDAELDADALQEEEMDTEISESDVMSLQVGEVSAITHYMKMISRYEPLSREEEQRLGLLIKAGNREAFDALVNANLKFVVSVAYKFKHSGLPLLDIINQGNLGLVEAAKRFDPLRGVKFISYAVWWIRQYIVQGVAEQTGTVRLPIKQASNLFKINHARERLSREILRDPTAKEIADELEMSDVEVQDILRVSRQSLSLESPIKEGDDNTFLSILEAEGASVEEGFLQENLREILYNMVEELEPREREIIRLRFGLADREEQTLDELGRAMGVSRERVRQLETRALAKLRKKAERIELQDYLSA